MGTWQLDPYHTQVGFSAKHLGMMTVRGQFAEVNATASIDPDHPESSWVEVTIPVAGIRTHNEIRDNDLRSSNFLEAEKYPTITFKSTSVVPTSDDHFTLNGDLTIKGTTLPVALEMTNLGEFNDPMMGHRIAYSGHGKINRKDFGMTLNMVLDGRFVVSEEVQITLEGELVEQQEPAEAAAPAETPAPAEAAAPAEVEPATS